ncbi:MAG: hypothetical protein B7Z80_20115 [Rhodospirillales bacterium 20-64-7]|nr:MAG: hypothetical protein B7Z80_20115 [Rhodospirillales bacterium 20-64-7]HQT78899.1 PAS domain-containing protein [Rhodopila sp.]
MKHTFLSGGGELATLIQSFDWGATSLGAIDAWPPTIRTTVGLMLRSPVPIVTLWGEDGVMIYNDAYSGFAGGRHPRLLGSRVREGWPEVAEFNDNVMKVGLAGGTLAYKDQELTLYRSGKAEQVWLDLDYSPVLDESGQAVGVIAIVVETTERVLAERRLAEQAHTLTVLNQIGTALAAELNPDQVIQQVTDAGVELIGAEFGAFFYTMRGEDGESYRLYALSGADRMHFQNFPPPSNTPLFQPTFQGEGVVRVDDVTSDPRYGRGASFTGMPPGHLPVRSYLAVPVVSRSGEVIGALLFGHSVPGRFELKHEALMTGLAAQAAIAIDNARLFQTIQRLNETLERRVSEALAERKLWADIVEGTDAFVQVVDLGYRWLAINKASADEFERIYGKRPQLGDNMLDMLTDRPDDQAAVKAVWRRALSGEEFTEVGEFGDPALDRRYYEMKFNVLRDKDGGQIGAYQFVYDVTDRLRDQTRLAEAEAALRQSQKMEAVGQLTGGLAHDFNNLLTGISGGLELLHSRIAQGRLTGLDRYIITARAAAERAAALTHRLLAFSRRQTLDPRPTDTNRLVAGMEELIRRTVGPAVAVEVSPTAGLWTTLVDPNQLESALLNLCINARDAMPNGGTLTIATANCQIEEQSTRKGDLPSGAYISLCVSDTGTGMTPDVAARAFDPFFTTKPTGSGTGLGLSMIYGFVQQSGGQVCIESEPGRGTEVCLYLPRHHGAAENAEPAIQVGGAPRAERGETVLVVDDESAVRLLVAEVLQELGYRAIEAMDGAAGLRIVQSDVPLDLLVTDVGLPGGLNGRQLADAARVIRPNLKVLFITGYAENAVLRHGQLAAGMHVMTKPFAMEALASRIKTIIAND